MSRTSTSIIENGAVSDDLSVLVAKATVRIAKSTRRMDSGCAEWIGQVSKSGYGQFSLDGKTVLAHRAVFLCAHGRWPHEGMHLDHLCRNRRCVNPAHLDEVTAAENNRRGTSPSAKNAAKTHCVRGHILEPVRGPLSNGSKRRCYVCKSQSTMRSRDPEQHKQYMRAYHAKRKEGRS
jgi:hypothetical protein